MNKRKPPEEDCSWETHHRIPQSYLKNFLWPDGKLKVRDISCNRIFYPKPAQIMCERGLNNLPSEIRGSMPANIVEKTIFGMWDALYPSMVRELQASEGKPNEKLARRLLMMALGLVFRSINGERIMNFVTDHGENENGIGTRPGDYPMFAGSAMMYSITNLGKHSAIRMHRATGHRHFNASDNPASCWILNTSSKKLSYHPDFFSKTPTGDDEGGMLFFPCTPDWLLEAYINDQPFPDEFPIFAVIDAEPNHVACANARIAEATHRFKVLAPPR